MTVRGIALSALAVLLLVLPAQARADVTHAGSASGTGAGSVTFSMTVPAGTDRVLAVGISTTEAGTVSAVSYGPQQLTRQLEAAADGARSEIWTLAGPNVGTANVTVTVAAGAPVIAGASTFTGVDQLNPYFPGALSTQNTGANSASLILGGTATRDGMFGTISIANAGNTANLRTQGSIDLVVADARWATAQGNVRGGGATRSGNTGANMAQNAGIGWLWNNTNPQALNPYGQTLLGLRASTATATAPTVTSPTATAITHNSATLGGNMTAIGGANITQRGVVYCTCANPQIGAADTTQLNAGASNTTGTFTVNASGLTASTQYTYRAFATNSAGIGYSAAATFNTSAPPNQAPTANAGGPYTINEGGSLTLDGSGSSDPDGNPLTYAWDVDNDGAFDDATGVNPTVSAATLANIGLGDGPDSSTVRVRVNDGTVNADAQTTLTVSNVAPSGTFGNGGAVGENSAGQVSFTGVTDPSAADQPGVRYGYDFDNNGTYEVGGGTYATASTSASVNVPASFFADGPATRTVRGAVIDKDNGLRSYTTAITVNNLAPTGTLANRSVQEGETASIGLTGVTDPSQVDRDAGLRYGYDFNADGTWDVGSATYATAVTATTADLPANLTSDGPVTRNVRVAVVDKDGGFTAYSATVSVTNRVPTGTLANRSVQEGSTASIGLTGVTDPSGPDTTAGLRYAYDFQADGTYDVGSLTYANAATATTADLPANLTDDGPATRNVRVAVVDKDGGFTAYDALVTVTNVAPSGTLSNNGPIEEGGTAQVSWAGVTDPSPADAAAGTRYAYDFGNDGTYEIGTETYATASALAAVNVPAALTADNGTVAVRAVMIDKDGGLRAFTTTVTVGNAAPTGTLANSGPVDEGSLAQVSYSGVTDTSPADVAAGIRYGYDFENDGTFEVGGDTYATASALAAVDVPTGLTADGDDDVEVRAVLVDKDGGVRLATTTVRVNNVAPTATLNGDAVDEGQIATVAFSAQADPSAADTAAGFSYEFDLDDDGTFEITGTDDTAALPAVLTENGPATLNVTAAIIDRDGGRREYPTTVTVANVAPTAAVTGPDAVPSSGAVSLEVDLGDASADDTLTATINWGDGTVDTITGRGKRTVSHTYATAGEYTVTVVTTDSDGAKSTPATHTLTVAAAPAAPAPTPTPTTPVTPASPKLTIDRVRVTPRCIRASNLRALTAQRRTVTVSFRLSTAAPVKFNLRRWTGKRGASKCPPAAGKVKSNGRKIVGTYSPHTNRNVAARAGTNKVRIAATGRRGKRLRPGTYLLTVTSGNVSARTKVWVLAN